MGNAVQGDLGKSLFSHVAVADDIAERFPITFGLVVMAMVFGLLVGLPLGIFSALRPGGRVDKSSRFATSVGIAIPSYWLAITGIPLLLLVVIFGILSLVAWKKGIAQTPYLASPRSGGGLLTLAFVGFVVGGLLAGALASPLIANLVDAGGAGATIRIVHNAALMTTQEPFSPGSWTVPVNGTVTWYNGDTMQHTVTSDTGTRVAFDSGFLESGATFSFKFTVPGNYTYHCTPHPWMRGTIIVL